MATAARDRLARTLRGDAQTYVNSFGKIADKYGQQWTAELLRTWFGGDQPSWAYLGEQERARWVSG